MTTQHSPAPWLVLYGGMTDDTHFTIGSKIIDKAICCSAPYPDRPSREIVANARLIASAPDLLAALEAIVKVNSRRRHPLGLPDEGIAYDAAQAMANARDAIAKAKS